MAPITPSLSFVMTIKFKRVSVGPVPIAAAVKAEPEILTANPAGAAVTASLASAAPNAAVDKATPRCVRSGCNLVKARVTRFRAASSLLPNASPTERKSRCSKNRSRMAVRSSAPSWLIASSRTGATRARAPPNDPAAPSEFSYHPPFSLRRAEGVGRIGVRHKIIRRVSEFTG